MSGDRENEFEVLWSMHLSGQIEPMQQNLLCEDSPAYNAYANGAYHRAKAMVWRMPIFWYAGGQIWHMSESRAPVWFPPYELDGERAVLHHEEYLEHMNDVIQAASRAGDLQTYQSACQAVAELIQARERYFSGLGL